MKKEEIDFTHSDYKQERLDLVTPQQGHNYLTKYKGVPREIEFIMNIAKRVTDYCTANNIQMNNRWEMVKSIFIYDGPGFHAWEKLATAHYPALGSRTAVALTGTFLPMLYDEILRRTENAKQIYTYLGRLKWDSSKFEIMTWTDRVDTIYGLADRMTATTRPTEMQRLELYMESIGTEYENKLKQCDGMSDIYDAANNGANPKTRREIAACISTFQTIKNKKKGLQLDADGSKYSKKDNGRGGGSSGSSGNKRGNSGDKDSGERSSKRQRTNGGGPKDEGGTSSREWKSFNPNSTGCH